MNRFAVALLLVSSMLPGWSAHGGTPQDLQSYLSDLRTLRADFVQRVQNPGSGRDRESRGQVLLQTPGKFRWDYREPYRQLIVADGTRVWFYDPDLEQVTVQPLDSAMGATPLGMLMGDAPLEEAFLVEDQGTAFGERWFELRPRQEDGQFVSIRLGLTDGELSALELEDALGQTTLLRFSDVERNVPLDPALLRFSPPPGVDVVGDD